VASFDGKATSLHHHHRSHRRSEFVLIHLSGSRYPRLIPSQRTGVVLHEVKRKVGFRRLEVVQQPLLDAPGTSFCFRINLIPFFIGGSNWIPLDSFLSNGTVERYRKWLELLVEGNQNMVRVWGGGVYEDDSFYKACVSLPSFPNIVVTAYLSLFS
jgi:beta-galactosidase/beta-glucuronidase